MLGFQGPAQPSPTLGDAGYGYLEVKCLGCRTHQTVALDIVRRPKTTSIRRLFRVVNQYVGNLPPMTGVFPDYPAPVVCNAGAARELTMMRWGMPLPPKFGGPPVTNVRNTSSPHWRGWLKP